MATPKHWLMKTEPEVFSIEDLAHRRRSLWDGVRNYQARNFMTKEMKIGSKVLIYHSSCPEPGVVGLAHVSAAAVADPSQFDPTSPYFEPRATKAKPVWYCVEVELVERFARIISLSELRRRDELKRMALLKRGQRLSIQPVTAWELKVILDLGQRHE